MAAVNLRIAAPEDGAALAAIYAPHVEPGYTSFELVAPGAAEMQRRIADTLRTHPWLVAERGGKVVGYAYACRHRERAAYQWSADVAVYLHGSAQRQGIGRMLYAELFAILRRHHYVNAFAGIALPNAASVALHEALGFRCLGIYRNVGYKAGAWRDVGWWQLQLRAPADPPPLPTAFVDPAGPR